MLYLSLIHILASMSCKAAVKGNNKMSTQEANALIDQLLSLENPYNCPHGRPTICLLYTSTTPAPKGDLIIVPGVAFSKKGERLGYGGGFYDRFLEHHKVYTIGVAYDFQIMNSLPTEEHDRKLNEIITN